jgi:hypothetical protein
MGAAGLVLEARNGERMMNFVTNPAAGIIPLRFCYAFLSLNPYMTGSGGTNRIPTETDIHGVNLEATSVTSGRATLTPESDS